MISSLRLALFSTGCFMLGSVVAWADEPGPAKPDRPRAAANVPSVKDIQRAFQGKVPLPRTRLLEQLQRAGAAADQPELVTTLAEELQSRINRTAVDPVDLQFVTLLATYY